MSGLLIIEDNREINDMLADTFRQRNYDVWSVYNGYEALAMLREQSYDLIILDIMLPYKSGDQILYELRKTSKTPVIVISAKDTVNTKIDLLTLGADDYITKPFDLDEVAARVAAVLRRFAPENRPDPVFCYKDLTVDDTAKTAAISGSTVDLTAREFQILALLISHPDKVFTKSNLYETIWQEDYLHDDNAVKTHISNLRSKLKQHNPDEEYIETVWGLGYRMHKCQ